MFKQWELAADAVNSFIAFTNKFLISSKLVAINEEINEQLPNFENKVEKLEIKKALLQVSNGETIEPISLIRASSPERVANAREQLRRQVLAALGPQRS
jgi:transcriptional regulator of NAD metabolism